MKTNKQDLVTLAISSHFPPPPPHLFCLSTSHFMNVCVARWAKPGLEVRLADETFECSDTGGVSLLGQSLINACELDLVLGEMFNILVHMLYRWASCMKNPFPVPSSESSGNFCLNPGISDYRA